MPSARDGAETLEERLTDWMEELRSRCAVQNDEADTASERGQRARDLAARPRTGEGRDRSRNSRLKERSRQIGSMRSTKSE
jgi:hypothetical protein